MNERVNERLPGRSPTYNGTNTINDDIVAVPWDDETTMPYMGKYAFGDVPTATYTDSPIESWKNARYTPMGQLRVLGPELPGENGEPPESDDTVDERFQRIEQSSAWRVIAPRGARRVALGVEYSGWNPDIVVFDNDKLEECAITLNGDAIVAACPKLKKIYVKATHAHIDVHRCNVVHCEIFDDYVCAYLKFDVPVSNDAPPQTSECVVVLRDKGKPRVLVKLRVKMHFMTESMDYSSVDNFVESHGYDGYHVNVNLHCYKNEYSVYITSYLIPPSCIERCEIWTVDGARIFGENDENATLGIQVKGNIKHLLLPNRKLVERFSKTKYKQNKVSVVDDVAFLMFAALSMENRTSEKTKHRSSGEKKLPIFPTELSGQLYSMLHGDDRFRGKSLKNM